MDPISSLQHFNSQDPSMSSSLSLPSEPPDVGNWFASYEYKSPDPDSNVNFEDTVFKGCESEKYGEGGRRSKFEKKTRTGDEMSAGDKLLTSSTYFEDDMHNKGLSLDKGLDSFTSDSVLLSEPPDIRNWFSSYVYESCVSDTSSLLGDFVSKESESECDIKGFVFEEENELEVRYEDVHPRESIKHSSSCDTNTRVKRPSSRGDGSVETKKNIGSGNTCQLENILQPCLQDTTLQHNVNPTTCEERINLNHESTRLPPEPVGENDIKETRLKANIQHENRPANIFSARNSTCLRDKENGGDGITTDGFVTTRKTRYSGANVENSSTNTCKKQAVEKRKALAQVTNLQKSNAMNMEVTGKWQCPQKGKPNHGPALKQLRLERWVHRN